MSPQPPIEQLRPLTPLKAHGSLALLVVHLLVAPYGLREAGSVTSVALQAGFYLLLVFVLIGVTTHRLELMVCIGLVVLSSLFRLVASPEDRVSRAIAEIALVVIGVIALALSMKRVFQTLRVTPTLISAAVSIYLLAGIVWAVGFQALETLTPGSFEVPDAEPGVLSTVTAGDLYYFSFVTLTTLGFGDVSPAAPATRSIAILEAVFGQLFLVVLIGRLVSLQVAPPQRSDDRDLQRHGLPTESR